MFIFPFSLFTYNSGIFAWQLSKEYLSILQNIHPQKDTTETVTWGWVVGVGVDKLWGVDSHWVGAEFQLMTKLKKYWAF